MIWRARYLLHCKAASIVANGVRWYFYHQDTLAHAQTLRERNERRYVEIRCLATTGDENDADKAFGHFSEVLGELIRAGNAPTNITLDFTRGTKAMSAALVLAGVAYGIPTPALYPWSSRSTRFRASRNGSSW